MKTLEIDVKSHRPEISNRAVLRPLANRDEYDALVKAAAADDHMVVWPTHVALKDGEIVGYASLGQVALLNIWSSTEKMTARDSFTLLRTLENELAAAGFPAVCAPCATHSPFRPLMSRMGYRFLFESGYFIKALQPPQKGAA